MTNSENLAFEAQLFHGKVTFHSWNIRSFIFKNIPSISKIVTSWRVLHTKQNTLQSISFEWVRVPNLGLLQFNNLPQLIKKKLFWWACGKKCTKTIKNNKLHLLKMNRLHYIAILSKSLKGLKLVSSLHNSVNNEFAMFAISCTNFWPNLIWYYLWFYRNNEKCLWWRHRFQRL